MIRGQTITVDVTMIVSHWRPDTGVIGSPEIEHFTLFGTEP